MDRHVFVVGDGGAGITNDWQSCQELVEEEAPVIFVSLGRDRHGDGKQSSEPVFGIGKQDIALVARANAHGLNMHAGRAVVQRTTRGAWA